MFAGGGLGVARSTTARPDFRPEIEGLRAVAALLVASYHVAVGRVSGGVDVFFVLSGYLVTESLLRQSGRDGYLDIAGFWKRLVRRLAPASFFILALAVIGGFLFLPPSFRVDAAKQILASAFYVENWFLAINAIDYTARDTLQSPVQHFWALSIQGQFYLLWPLVIATAFAMAKRLVRSGRDVLLGVLLTAFAASFAYSVAITHTNQAWAYFDSLARFWEFGLGALLAVTAFRPALPSTLAAILGWIALAAIISCGMVFQAADSFPGLAALWPTLAAATLLLVGSSGGRWGVHRLLSSRPMVALGGVSYHIYLWHWLILIFLLRLKWSDKATDLEGLLIVLASIGLAFITVEWIEKPIRAGRPVHLAIKTAAAAVAAFVVFVPPLIIANARVEPGAAVADMRYYPGAAVLLAGRSQTLPDGLPILPRPMRARLDLPKPPDFRCPDRIVASGRYGCRLGERQRPRKEIAVVGASHSGQYMPAFMRLGDERDWAILDFTTTTCRWASGAEDQSCRDRNAAVTKAVIAERPDLVVTTANIRRDPAVPKAYAAIWKEVTDAGIPILAIRDNPSFDFNIPACVEWYGWKGDECSVPRGEMLGSKTPEDFLPSKTDRVHFLDLSNYFCDRQECPPVIGNVLIYRDSDHLTATYARSLAPVIGKEIDDLLRKF